MAQEQTYYVKGMHCAACEILIEKKLLDIQSVKSVDASTAKGQVVFEYEGNKPEITELNSIFKKDNYTFSNTPIEISNEQASKTTNPILIPLAISAVIIMLFLLLDRTGIANILSLNSQSSLLAFFGLGILAGLSSCAALVGGIVLSMSKQWQELYSHQDSTTKKLEPHILFNVGRLLSYAILGGVLGLIGSRLQISFQFTALLTIVISLVMIGLGLQMLGVKGFRKLQVGLPKFITRGIASENNFKGKYMPFAMGALTFFLPCGFTITAQGLALLSGNPVSGALIMGLFALGTAPMLLLIGLSSVKFFSNQNRAEQFTKVAGFLVLFFAIYNIYNQISIFGIPFIK